MKNSVVIEGEADDHSLVDAVLTGDDDAFTELVRKYETRVRGYCRNMLGETAAEDAAQEVFFKVYRSLSSFQKDSSFSTWLYRISANYCIDELRKNKLRKFLSFDFQQNNNDREASDRRRGESSRTAGLEEQVENRETLMAVLATLPAHRRSLIVMCEVYGLSYQELAEMHNCTLDSIKSKLKRARRKLVEAKKSLELKIAEEFEQNG